MVGKDLLSPLTAVSAAGSGVGAAVGSGVGAAVGSDAGAAVGSGILFPEPQPGRKASISRHSVKARNRFMRIIDCVSFSKPLRGGARSGGKSGRPETVRLRSLAVSI